MARPIWSGAISFGLVSIPVRLYPATEQQDVRFNQFQEGTGQRIRYKRVAEGSGREVPFEKIVKGYEVEKGKWVIVTPEELEGVAPDKTRTIEVEDFVDLGDIDPIYFEKAYYLAPADSAGAEKAYALMLKALEDSGRAGIARFVMRSKEYLAAIRPVDGVLALETLFFPDEVRSTKEVDNVPVRRKTNEREVRMAKQLIDSLVSDWDPKRYSDTYRERVLRLIRDKAKGKEVVLPEEEQRPQVADLMEALKRSIEATKKGQRPAEALDDEDYASWTKDRLAEKAAQLDIGGRSTMSKGDLVKALRKAS